METLVGNLKEKTSGMSVYSFLHYVTGNVQFNEAITSTRRHWSTIWKKSLLTCLYIPFYMMPRAKFSWTRLKKQGRHWSTIWKKRFMACLYIPFYVMSRAKFSWTRLWHQQGDTGRLLKEKTSGMSVYSFLHYVSGKVQLNEALTSTRRLLVDNL